MGLEIPFFLLESNVTEGRFQISGQFRQIPAAIIKANPNDTRMPQVRENTRLRQACVERRFELILKILDGFFDLVAKLNGNKGAYHFSHG